MKYKGNKVETVEDKGVCVGCVVEFADDFCLKHNCESVVFKYATSQEELESKLSERDIHIGLLERANHEVAKVNKDLKAKLSISQDWAKSLSIKLKCANEELEAHNKLVPGMHEKLDRIQEMSMNIAKERDILKLDNKQLIASQKRLFAENEDLKMRLGIIKSATH